VFRVGMAGLIANPKMKSSIALIRMREETRIGHDFDPTLESSVLFSLVEEACSVDLPSKLIYWELLLVIKLLSGFTLEEYFISCPRHDADDTAVK